MEGEGNDGNGAMVVELVGLFEPLSAPVEDLGVIAVAP